MRKKTRIARLGPGMSKILEILSSGSASRAPRQLYESRNSFSTAVIGHVFLRNFPDSTNECRRLSFFGETFCSGREIRLSSRLF